MVKVIKFRKNVSRFLRVILVLSILLGIQPTKKVQAFTITVDTLVDEYDLSCGDGDCSLRDALYKAVGGTTINFSVTGTIVLNGSLVIDDTYLTIEGPGQQNLTIDGAAVGGVFLNSSASNHTVISNLTITNGLKTEGGGIYNRGVLYLENVAMTNNNASLGGAIYNRSGASLTIIDCEIHDNTASSSGGALFNSSGSVVINRSSIYANAANFGAGIYNSDGDIELRRSTISGNTAIFSGGGVYNEDGEENYLGSAEISYSTITENSAQDGGGIYNSVFAGGLAETKLMSSLIVGNHESDGSGTEDCYIASGDLISEDYNLTGTGTGCVLGGAHDQISIDPLLNPLEDNGGLTDTHALLPGSPALDQIPEGVNDCVTQDQRGVAKPIGSGCDIGAYESRGFTLNLTSGSSQSTLIDTAFPTTLALSISSDSSEPVDGGKVSFTAPASGASTTFAPTIDVTIAGGSASLPVTANGIAGPYSVSASTAGASPTLYFDLENIDTSPPINDYVGFYVPSKYHWYLKTDQTDGWGGVTSIGWGGVSELIPVTGDWNGDGMDTAAFYKPSQWRWFLKNDHTDGWAGVTNFQWGGSAEMIPIAGDWDGDGDDTVGFYKPSTAEWYLKDDNTGGWTGFTKVVWGGAAGNIPIVGDWDGDGYDTIGFFVPSSNRWWLKNDLVDGWAGVAGFTFGTTDSMDPVVGDWDGDGVDTVGGYVAAKWRWFLKDDQVSGWSNVSNLKFGVTTGYDVIAGDWE